jgi:hypothetical protein
MQVDRRKRRERSGHASEIVLSKWWSRKTCGAPFRRYGPEGIGHADGILFNPVARRPGNEGLKKDATGLGNGALCGLEMENLFSVISRV